MEQSDELCPLAERGATPQEFPPQEFPPQEFPQTPGEWRSKEKNLVSPKFSGFLLRGQQSPDLGQAFCIESEFGKPENPASPVVAPSTIMHI